MRIGFVSDTHGDPGAWEKAMAVLGNVDLITHAGDVLYHGIFNPITESYDPRGLAGMLNVIEVPMVHARGNCDSEVDQLALDNHILSDFAFVSAEGFRILVTHGHKQPDERLAEVAGRANVHLVHRGHTHVPKIEVVGGVVLFNAGSVAVPKQDGGARTVGLYEEGTLRVLDIDTGEVFAEGRFPA